jgi:hypothetical protein
MGALSFSAMCAASTENLPRLGGAMSGVTAFSHRTGVCFRRTNGLPRPRCVAPRRQVGASRATCFCEAAPQIAADPCGTLPCGWAGLIGRVENGLHQLSSDRCFTEAVPFRLRALWPSRYDIGGARGQLGTKARDGETGWGLQKRRRGFELMR